MSLVTRCPACNTHFRVVADQLRISDGWVRCGRCEEVFDASLQLLPVIAPVSRELSREEVPAASVSDSSADVQHVESDSSFEMPETPESVGSSELNLIFPDTVQLPSEAGPVSSDDQAGPLAPNIEASTLDEVNPLPDVSEGTELEKSGAMEDAAAGGGLSEAPSAQPEPEPELGPRFEEHLAAAVKLQQDSDFGSSAALSATSEPLAAAEPDFGRTSLFRSIPSSVQPQAAWVGVVQWLVAVCLLIALAFQWVRHAHDEIASAFPAAVPTVELFCQWSGCEVQALRRIDAVAIESSSLNRAQAGVYRLQLALRNNAHIPIAVPAVELVLTDFHDQAMVRRVIAGPELGLTSPAMSPGEDLQLHLPLRVLAPAQPERVTGYRVVVFYP